MATSEYKLVFQKESVDNILQTKDDKTTEYIILQNNTLHSILGNLHKKLHDLKIEKRDLEEDNDRLQTCKTYISGLARNRFEIAVEYKYIINEQEKIIGSLERMLGFFYFNESIGLCAPYLLIVLYMLFKNMFSWSTLYIDISFTCIISTHVFLCMKSIYKKYVLFHKKLICKDNYERIYEKENEIKKMEDANNYFHELVDNY